MHEKLRLSVVSSKNKKQYEIDVVSLGLNKEDVIYIGDAYSDLLASRNAGIDFAFAKWGSVESKDMSDSDYILEKVEDLLRLL
ncbi:MAG: HAD hydrolase-like protein [Catenibacterium mitsuokai]|nr:HAD hydrolase-like protein [Catenibacterium mitsuokai]MDD6596393.1 HAD hydrolase-like protein [Catenibacterium mitsuokai]MEE0082352.1 HAD hydrolase-like protein [Catenibacterium mitsuokai]